MNQRGHIFIPHTHPLGLSCEAPPIALLYRSSPVTPHPGQKILYRLTIDVFLIVQWTVGFVLLSQNTPAKTAHVVSQEGPSLSKVWRDIQLYMWGCKGRGRGRERERERGRERGRGGAGERGRERGKKRRKEREWGRENKLCDRWPTISFIIRHSKL